VPHPAPPFPTGLGGGGTAQAARLRQQSAAAGKPASSQLEP